jgi:hypothetical protein
LTVFVVPSLGRALACALVFPLLAACTAHAEPPSRISLAPSLRPVDAARPLVIFSQVRGEACGNDAVAGAIRNLKRLTHVDGYVEIVVEETGEKDGRCARVTAYPFRYGTSTDLPAVAAGEEPTAPLVVPGATPTAAAGGPGGGGSSGVVPAFDCTSACQKLAALVASGSIEQSLAKERCITRCSKPDSGFQGCIGAAKDQPAAKACLTP